MAESKGFDLSALIKSVPDLGTDRQQIEYIPIEKIDPDPENFYSLDGLNELAGSIEMLGLQQALLLRPGENGHYTLISGHRRRAAILMIRDGGSDQFKDGVPCVVDRRNASKALWKFQLLMANKDTRKMTSADENRQAEELENVLRELEDAGYEFPGRLRDWVSELSGMSRSKLNRLKVIREKLAPEIKTKYYDTGKLNENTAYTLAKMEPELQLKLFKASQNATAAGYERIAAIVKAGNDYNCAELTGPGCSKCTHGTAFLRHDLEEPLDPCKGETCCLRCNQSSRDYYPCERMCSKAKDRRTKRNAAEKDRQEKERKRKAENLRREIQASAIRLVKAADAAGVGDDVKLPMSNGYFSARTVAWVRAAAEGGEIGMVYENDLDPKRLNVTAAAQALHCSADYICGLTEELRPKERADVDLPRTAAPAEESGEASIAFRWRTGEPGEKDSGWAAVLLDGCGTRLHRLLYWRDGAWSLNEKLGAPRLDREWTAVAWFPLPGEEEV